jgi:TetR/AcrR family transcriptional repressor of mexJK operon
MTEIAKDISFSKALLYYYFPDKLSLYVSTIEYLMQIMSRDLVRSIDKTTTSTEGVLKLLQKRQSYIQKYYNLFESNQIIGNDLPKGLNEKFQRARTFEAIILSSLFSRGIASGELAMEDPKLATDIFIDALSGIHFNILTKDKNIHPAKEQFKQIFIKERMFAEIFLSGLQSKH